MENEYETKRPLGTLTQSGETDQTNHAMIAPKNGSNFSSAGKQRLPEFEVTLEPDDRDNPRNWSTLYRAWVIFTIAFCALLVVLFSTSFTSSIPALEHEFNATKLTTTLGVTTYLLGMATGSLLMSPISELYGRRIVYCVCFSIWTVLIVPCGLAQSLSVLLGVRFFGGLFGAALVSNGPGTVVDISTPQYLGLGMSLYSLGPFNGPVLGPLIGGVVFEHLGWRWTNWMVLILAALANVMMLTLKETYAPEIVRQKTRERRRRLGDTRWWSKHDREEKTLGSVQVYLRRPLTLFFTEPIVWFINIWTALIYGILYLCFIAYPVVFSDHRGWSPSQVGMSYLGIGAGIVLAIAAEPLARQVINSRPCEAATGKPAPEAVAPIMALGSVLTAIGQLGFAWTCLPLSIHWSVSICFGIPFGLGNTLSFIYSSSYLAQAYTIFAASALASNAVIRSLFGALLPLAGSEMYVTLSTQMAGTVCGLLAVAMIPIPFIFWRYGHKLRHRSKTIKHLRGDF